MLKKDWGTYALVLQGVWFSLWEVPAQVSLVVVSLFVVQVKIVRAVLVVESPHWL
jgi:hypothetical protein